ncbi:MAG: hypothetical protein PVS3B3_16560 [Ktedonobacteraceae bacterium]
MQQDTTTQGIDQGSSTHMTLLAAQRELGVSRGTLKEYLIYLGIEPLCFHIGTRSLCISRNAMGQVKHLKQKPALLVQLPSPRSVPINEERDGSRDTKRKDAFHGI